MGSAIGKIIEELLGVFKRNYKRPKLWITVFLCIIILVLIFPFIDSNFLYFSRMEKRIDILKKVMELDQEKINSNPVYIKEYQSILQEIDQQGERSINSISNKFISFIDYHVMYSKSAGNRVVKGITGAIWFIIIAIWIPFMNTFNKKSDKLLAFFLISFLAVLVASFFSVFPIIVSPWVNYVGIPLVQLIIVVVWAVRSNGK